MSSHLCQFFVLIISRLFHIYCIWNENFLTFISGIGLNMCSNKGIIQKLTLHITSFYCFVKINHICAPLTQKKRLQFNSLTLMVRGWLCLHFYPTAISPWKRSLEVSNFETFPNSLWTLRKSKKWFFPAFLVIWKGQA